MHKRKTATPGKLKKASLKPMDEWERAWQRNWSKVGMPGYELPIGGPGGEERKFLAEVRTPEKEWTRLERIQDEFVRGFKGLYLLGPAPEGMSATTALRNKWYTRRHAAINAVVTEKAKRFEQEREYAPPYWRLIEMARQAKNRM
jgi:hypothetical protein